MSERENRKPKYPIAEYKDMEMPNGDTDVSYSHRESHLARCRKDWQCLYCGIPIPKGDYCLIEKGFCDGEPYAIHYCLDCVEEEMDVWNHKLERDEAYESWKARYEKWGVVRSTD